jgi:hypothetical protein
LDGETAALNGFPATSDSVALAVAFGRIRNPHVRRAMVEQIVAEPVELRRQQASQGVSMSRPPAALRLSLHADLVLVAQRSRGVLRQTCQAATKARRLPWRGRSSSRHQPLRRAEQPTPQILRLDRIAAVRRGHQVLDSIH